MRSPRSAFVTALAWLVMAASALLLPISFISLLMILAGGDGTQSVTVLGFLGVVVAPAAAFVAGVGLLWRQSWAWYAVVALLLVLIATNLHELATRRDTTTTHRSASGVQTTVLASEPNRHSVPIIVACGLLLVGLCSRRIRSELGVAPEDDASRRA